MPSPADAGRRLPLLRMCTWPLVQLLAIQDLKRVRRQGRKLGQKHVRLPRQGRKLVRSQGVPRRKQGLHRGPKRDRKQGLKHVRKHGLKHGQHSPLVRRQGPHRRLVRLSIPQPVRLPSRRRIRNPKSPRKDARSNGEEIPVNELRCSLGSCFGLGEQFS